jgi:hypothetical protein
MRFQSRSAFGWPASAAGRANPTKGLVIHYDGSNQGLARKAHSSCVAYWKSTRSFHMGPSRGWADIGYSFGACPHGYVMEGRGLGRVQAAQPGGNDTWYSVTLMSGPSEDPTPEQINAVRELRAWLMGKGVAGAVRGHRDFISTSCPGDKLYKLVKDGTFAKASSEEDDMPEYVSVGIDEPIDLPPGQWVTVAWGKEYSDRDHHHWNEGGTTFVVGPARYGCTANVRIDGLTPGTELQARVIEVAEDGSKTEPGPIAEYTASQGATFLHYNLAADTVNSKFRVRFQVIHYGTETGRITSGSAKAFVWPT